MTLANLRNIAKEKYLALKDSLTIQKYRFLWRGGQGAGNEGNLHAWRIRKLLSSDTITAEDKRVKLVGISAYIAAGGKITRDLFDDGGTLIHDEELIDRLADERIAATREEILNEGWEWVEVEADIYSNRYSNYRQEHPTPGTPTEAEQQRMDEITALLETDDDHPDEHALSQEFQEIEARVEDRAVWSDEIMAKSGVFLSVGWDGNFNISKGWMTRNATAAQNNESADGGEVVKQTPLYSNALKDMVAKSRTQIVRAALTGASAICNDILAFNLAMHAGAGNVNAIGCTGFTRWDAVGEPDPAHPSYNALEGIRKSLDHSWLQAGEWQECFELFRKISPDAKQAWINYAVAMSVSVSASNNMPDNIMESIITELDINWSQQYRPDKEFFKRLRKGVMLEMMRPVLGEDWVKNHASTKKSALVDVLTEIVAGTRNSLTAEQKAAIADWVPDGFAPSGHEGHADDSEASDMNKNDSDGSTPEVSLRQVA